ncbi:MAG: hypothetical protein KF911_01655 [Pseudomonadales bacterium]|nr:hypothetical protein [Pseudomonadales bacterium]
MMIESAPELLQVVLLSAAVASVHLWRVRFEALLARWKDIWMPLIGGFALGYVALYLLPKLGAKHQAILAADSDAPFLWQFRTYLVLLLGAQLYLVLLNLRKRGHVAGAAFGHLITFGRLSYSFLGGYLLVGFAGSALSQSLAALVLGVHLIGLETHLSTEDAKRRMQWVLVAAVMTGTLVGLLFESMAIAAPLNALLAGGILAVVMTDEAPARTQRLSAFVVGSLLLVLIAAVIRANR